MATGMDLEMHRLSPSNESGLSSLGIVPSSQAQQGSVARDDARGTIATSAPERSQSPLSEPPKTLLVIAIALVVSVLEAVFSMRNAVQEDAFRLTDFEDYVYAASSLMEVVGCLFGLACYFGIERSTKHLGLPLTLISAGVVEDDEVSRTIGFNGTVLQAAGIFLLLAVWLCLTIDWFFLVIVTFVGMCCYIWCLSYWPSTAHLFARERAISLTAKVLPPALKRRRREIPMWTYMSLPFSPVIIELLESYFLLKDFSLDRLILLGIDVLVVLPGIAWLVVQVFNCFKPFASSTP